MPVPELPASNSNGSTTELQFFDYLPGWRPSNTNLPVFSSQTDFQQNCELTSSSLAPFSYFTSLHSTEMDRQSQTQNQNYFTTGGLPPINSSWRQAL
jgi:hypothetical protein